MLRATSMPVSWLIIDWWGNLWIRIALSHPRWSDSQIYMRMQASLMQLNSMSASYGVSTIMLQQYAGNERNMTKPKTTDAQGNKNMTGAQVQTVNAALDILQSGMEHKIGAAAVETAAQQQQAESTVMPPDQGQPPQGGGMPQPDASQGPPDQGAPTQ